jgi:hypothetical protein
VWCAIFLINQLKKGALLRMLDPEDEAAMIL